MRQLLPGVPIFASGDLDEYKITQLQAEGACIDGYGLGTQLVTGAPVNGVYKLVEIDGIPVMKEATAKVSYPGRKQIVRRYEGGQMVGDRLELMEEGEGRRQEAEGRRQEAGGRRQKAEEGAPHTPHPTPHTPHPISHSLTGEQSLMQLVMKQGQRLYETETLETIAQRTVHSVASLPTIARQINTPIAISVEPSDALLDLIAKNSTETTEHRS